MKPILVFDVSIASGDEALLPGVAPEDHSIYNDSPALLEDVHGSHTLSTHGLALKSETDIKQSEVERTRWSESDSKMLSEGEGKRGSESESKRAFEVFKVAIGTASKVP